MKLARKVPFLVVAVFFLMAALYWAVYAAAPGFHQRFFRGEDKLVEWLTFGGFLLASLVTAGTLRMAWVGMDRWSRCYFAGLAFFFFVCAGEELSWGQRIIGFETPASIKAQNEQKEFNFHNIDFEHFHPVMVVSLFMKVFGIVLPVGCALAWRGGGPVWRRYVAPLALVPCFLFAELAVPVAKATANRIEPRVGPDVARVIKLDTAELKEMYWGLSVMLASLSLRGAWRRRRVECQVSRGEAA